MLCGESHVGAHEGRRCTMLEPAELYELTEADVPAAAPVLIVALDGFRRRGERRPAGRRGDARGAGGAHAGAVRRRPAHRLPVPPAPAAVRHRPLGVLRGARPGRRRAHRHGGHRVPAAGRARAGLAVGAVRRRGRAARRAVRGAAGDQHVGDPDGRAAHPADRRHRARHPPRAHRGPRGLVHRGRRARQRRRPDGAAAGRGGPRRDGLRRARAALPGAGGVPAGRARARRPRRRSRAGSTSPPRRCRWPPSGPRRRSASRWRRRTR